MAKSKSIFDIREFINDCNLTDKVNLLRELSQDTKLIIRITPLESVKLQPVNIRLSPITNPIAQTIKEATIEIVAIQMNKS